MTHIIRLIIDSFVSIVGYITIMTWVGDKISDIWLAWQQKKVKRKKKRYGKGLYEQLKENHHPIYREQDLSFFNDLLEAPTTMELRRKYPNLLPWEIKWIDDYLREEHKENLLKGLDEAEVVEFISNNQKQLP